MAVIENGTGPTALLCADVDALPFNEQTGLEYASTKHVVDASDGKDKPTTHACAHDMHIVAWRAAGELLLSPL